MITIQAEEPDDMAESNRIDREALMRHVAFSTAIDARAAENIANAISEDRDAKHAVRAYRRQPAHDAVYQVIAALPPRSEGDYNQAAENGRIWRAVEAALDAMEVPR